MPEPTSAARELTATGAPGPWRWRKSSKYGRVDVFRHPYMPGDEMIAVEVDVYDAFKITCAVNALEPWADYDDAVIAYLRHQALCTDGFECRELWDLWDDFCLKRNAVEAVLRGEQP